MTATDRMHMHGASVLVRSTEDHHNPPTALRGTIDAQAGDGSDQPRVRIVLEYPDMFTVPAHQGIIDLDEAGADRLRASEHDGVYEFTIDEPLEPKLPDVGEQEVS